MISNSHERLLSLATQRAKTIENLRTEIYWLKKQKEELLVLAICLVAITVTTIFLAVGF